MSSYPRDSPTTLRQPRIPLLRDPPTIRQDVSRAISYGRPDKPLSSRLEKWRDRKGWYTYANLTDVSPEPTFARIHVIDTLHIPRDVVQVLPGLWLGYASHAQDRERLYTLRISSVLDVSTRVSQFKPSWVYRSSHSHVQTAEPDPSLPAGISRPTMFYRKVAWSLDGLVESTFLPAISFIDQAMDREDGVLILCVRIRATVYMIWTFFSPRLT